jgi:outer membrane receptor protein involved in Fe transport
MGRVFLTLLSASVLAVAGPAVARVNAMSVDIRAGPLADALLNLASQSGVELLFDRDQVAGLQARPIHDRLTFDTALQSLLRDTGLTVRRTSFGVIIVEQRIAPPLARPDVTVPEVLVIGRRSQNADIRRLETDIQPYRVATGAQIVEADRDNLDQFFRSRVPSNAIAVPPSLDVKGETLSEIDLRGLGSNATLVLIDGRRMPSVPAPIFGFRQPDLNAVPLHAIERVEILTGAAGGIHGFGALGGVVNVVLARGERGAELHATSGVTSRGDSRQFTLEGQIGFSPDDGRTEVSLYASGFHSEPLLTGRRGYVSEDTALAGQFAPLILQALRPNGNSVFVYGTSGSPTLTFKPQFGGATIDARYSLLPAGLSGAPAEVASALIQNAGRFDTGLSDGGAATGITSNPRSAAVLANVRRKFDGGLEAYLDAVMLWDRGRYVAQKGNGIALFPASSPFNPFVQSVQVSFPVAGFNLERTSHFDSARYTAGLLAPLPLDWRAVGEFTAGSAHYSSTQTLIDYTPPFVFTPGPDPNPFGSWTAFQASLASYMATTVNMQAITNRYRDLSLRLAGPVFKAPGGPATLTLLAERRTESVPAYLNLTGNSASPSVTRFAARTSATASIYAELRSRVFGESAPAPVRNLEVQLAVRHDRETDAFARNPRAPDTTERLRARFDGTVYTVGAKVSPAPWLTLRGSYATGATPPPLADLIETIVTTNFLGPLDDPKRGGRVVGRSPVTFKLAGSPELGTVRASTTSYGAILAPLGQDGPRLSIDYSSIRKTDDVFRPTQQLVIDHEATWPERVVRGPLTDADRALGYSAGPITVLDTRAANAAGLKVDTIDAHLEWRPRLLDGRLRLYGDATYYVRQVQTAPFQKEVELVGLLGRPLERRANAGAEWSIGSVTVGANVQYFGSYRIYPAGQPDSVIGQAVSLQGAARVPSQTYLDLHASWRGRLRVAGAAQNVRADLGVINVFDRSPPRESAYSLAQFSGIGVAGPPGYSRYGDPRQRRFLLTLSAAF